MIWKILTLFLDSDCTIACQSGLGFTPCSSQCPFPRETDTLSARGKCREEMHKRGIGQQDKEDSSHYKYLKRKDKYFLPSNILAFENYG